MFQYENKDSNFQFLIGYLVDFERMNQLLVDLLNKGD
jgi:hypothetical protein